MKSGFADQGQPVSGQKPDNPQQNNTVINPWCPGLVFLAVHCRKVIDTECDENQATPAIQCKGYNQSTGYQHAIPEEPPSIRVDFLRSEERRVGKGCRFDMETQECRKNRKDMINRVR